MPNTVLGAQLYTVREYMKTPEDIAKSLKRIKEIGYDAVQLSGLGPIDPYQLKDILDKEQLEAGATHISFERMQQDLDGVIREHKLWNCKYVGIGGMPGAYSTSGEGFAKFAKEASEIARKLNDNGLRFVYHNHSFEFQKFDGITGMEILFNESDPEVFEFEIDTYWVQAGGGDPIAWIKKMKNRMGVVHFKDMTISSERKQIMAEVGEGNLNWPGIVEACKEIGVRWYMVEQDVCQRNPFESLAISLKNLHSMGLK